MVYITSNAYGDAYHSILTAYRRSHATSASSIVLLVAPDVDALCAARTLQDLFRQDDILHRIIPMSGMESLEQQREELMHQRDLHTLILLNMGSILDLPSSEWFGDFPHHLTVHVIDSFRPQNLSSLFDTSQAGQRVVIWDDGGTAKMEEERTAWQALMAYPEDEDSDGESDDSEDDLRVTEDGDASGTESETSSGKRRRSGGSGDSRKRRRVDTQDDRPDRLSGHLRDAYRQRIEKHYSLGTWHGQAASGIMYALAVTLERVDNDTLWYAILGLTYQYATSRISRETYENFHKLFFDEAARLNPPLPPTQSASQSLHPDDSSIRPTEELRFTLFRHWTLYDSMFHSSYVANKLGIWKERGRKKLTGLLAKMGFSIPQTQQPYMHMDMDLKRELRTKLETIAPEYGLLELTYPSFTRCYGYRSQPLSAADMVEGISALLDVAGGVRIEVEIEGARNGGEWFGGGRVWSARGSEKWKDAERENIPPGEVMPQKNKTRGANGHENEENVSDKPLDWWIKNFWTAFDALNDITRIREALSLSMSLHRAIIRQGTSIIDKQDIRTMRGHRVVVLTQGPDLALFAHPGVLSRLALWLVEAMRDRIQDGKTSRSGRKSLPFVVACLNEKAQRYMVVGVTAAPEFGDVRKNRFGLAFLDAKARCNARTRHGSFDTSVLEINQEDLTIFLQTLCNESLATR